MRAVDLCIIGELVMGHGRIRAERRHMHVTDVAALPLASLILQVFDEFLLGLPLTPAVSRHEAIRKILLGPRYIVVHLCFCGILLQLLDLLRDIAGLRVNIRG